MIRSKLMANDLDDFVRKLKDMFDIDDDFVESTEHKYMCRCDKCRRWWKAMGQDPETNSYGPFEWYEIEETPEAVLMLEAVTFHENGDDREHPTENFRSCTHPKCADHRNRLNKILKDAGKK
jgi:hypothetical protein